MGKMVLLQNRRTLALLCLTVLVKATHGAFSHRSHFLQSRRQILHPGQKHQRSRRRESSCSRCRNGLMMYFDDVSRNVISWHPDSDFLHEMGGEDQAMEDQRRKNASKEKMDAMRKMLYSHDAVSGAALNDEEVKEHLTEWASKCGLTGTDIGDEVYESIKDIFVCRSTTITGCLAEYWDHVSEVIQSESALGWLKDKTDGSKITMITFPNCPELYEYQKMSTMHAAVDFCADVCLHFGSKFSLTHFHPKYKNAPKMIHPTRHSPFPTLGLHFSGEYDNYVDRLSKKYGTDSKQRVLSKHTPPPQPYWAKERAATFEVLYNKAASSSTADVLTRGTASRNISQRFPKGEVVEMTQKWIKEAQTITPKSTSSASSGKTSATEVNKALRFSGTVKDWRVVYAKLPEEVYAEVWKAIHDLVAIELTDSTEEMQHDDDKDSSPAGARFSQIEWMNSLSRTFNGGYGSKHNKDDSSLGRKVVSIMFITTKFRAYNAEGFKRFAITVNAALKRLTDGKMFLEVFHPEYVGKRGYHNDFRRSPYPTLQICYEKDSDESMEKKQ